MLHSVSHFQLLGSIGSVTTGVMNSIRAISVFGISAIFFCSSDHKQCYTLAKLLSTCVVIAGILIYSYGKSRLLVVSKEETMEKRSKPSMRVTLSTISEEDQEHGSPFRKEVRIIRNDSAEARKSE